MKNLLNSFISFFPHYNRYNLTIITQYIKNLFHISSYIPSLKYKILENVVEKCLEIDVEIVIEDSGDVRLILENEKDMLKNINNDLIETSTNHHHNENDDDDNDDIFQFDDENEKKISLINSNNEDKSKIPTVVSDLADKLDAMLVLIVTFLEDEINKEEKVALASSSVNPSSSNLMKSTQSFPNLLTEPKENVTLKTSVSLSSLSSLNTSNTSISTSLSSTTTETSTSTSTSSIINSFSNYPKLYINLLNIFESKLLTTYKSKYVQFFLFFVTTKNYQFGELFILRLLEIGLDDSVSPVLRSSALMYLASFLSRASFLKLEIIGKVITRLVTWSSLYIIKNHAYHAELFASKDYSINSSQESATNLTKESFSYSSSSTPLSIISAIKSFLKSINNKKNDEIFNNSFHESYSSSSYRDILMKGLDQNVNSHVENFLSSSSNPSFPEGSPLHYDTMPTTSRNTPCFTDIYDVNKLKNELENILRNNFDQSSSSPTSSSPSSSSTPYLDSNFVYYEDEQPNNIDLLYRNCFSYNDYGSLKFNMPQGSQHEVFYTAVQTICYILCFHGLPLINLLFNNDKLISSSPELLYSSEFLPSYLNQILFDLIFTSRLCPTRFMTRYIVLEFIKLSVHVKLFSEYAWWWLREELLQYSILQEICANLATNPSNNTPSTTNPSTNQASSMMGGSYMGGSYMGGSYMGGSYMGGSYVGSYMSNYAGSYQGSSMEGLGNSAHNTAYNQLLEQQFFYNLCINEYGLFSGVNNVQLILDTCNNSSASNLQSNYLYNSRYLTISPSYSSNSTSILETFFPFDPCLLSRLHLLIEGNYRIWNGIPGLNLLQNEQIKYYIDFQERKKVDNYIEKYTLNNSSNLSLTRNSSTSNEDYDEHSYDDEYEDYLDPKSKRRYNL